MISKNVESAETLLQIGNEHVEPPPTLEGADYVSYFEGSFGDQWVFAGWRDKQEAKLFGGDIGWGEGHALDADAKMVPPLFLNEAEASWLLACWISFSNDKFEAVVGRWQSQLRALNARMPSRS